jgi:hypothetical protein
LVGIETSNTERERRENDAKGKTKKCKESVDAFFVFLVLRGLPLCFSFNTTPVKVAA